MPLNEQEDYVRSCDIAVTGGGPCGMGALTAPDTQLSVVAFEAAMCGNTKRNTRGSAKGNRKGDGGIAKGTQLIDFADG